MSTAEYVDDTYNFCGPDLKQSMIFEPKIIRNIDMLTSTTLRYAVTVCSVFVVMTRGAATSTWNTTHDHVDPKWIRLCTLTRNGSSRLNVTMPCGIRFEDESEVDKVLNRRQDFPIADDREDDQHHVESIGDSVGTHREASDPNDFVETKITHNSSNRTEAADDGDCEDGGGEVCVEDVNDGDDGVVTVEDEITVGTVPDEDNGEQEEGDENRRNGDDNDVQENVSVQTAFKSDGKQDVLERQRRDAIKKAMIAYLTSAKHQLYKKIKYLLDLLQHAFFNAQLKRRIRRDSIDRQTKSPTKRTQVIKKKQSNNMFSAITEPSFERSLMTMSFLMFGVFVIQVIQRLMHTIQKSGDIGSLGNMFAGSLPTTSSSIFN